MNLVRTCGCRVGDKTQTKRKETFGEILKGSRKLLGNRVLGKRKQADINPWTLFQVHERTRRGSRVQNEEETQDTSSCIGLREDAVIPKS